MNRQHRDGLEALIAVNRTFELAAMRVCTGVTELATELRLAGLTHLIPSELQAQPPGRPLFFAPCAIPHDEVIVSCSISGRKIRIWQCQACRQLRVDSPATRVAPRYEPAEIACLLGHLPTEFDQGAMYRAITASGIALGRTNPQIAMFSLRRKLLRDGVVRLIGRRPIRYQKAAGLGGRG